MIALDAPSMPRSNANQVMHSSLSVSSLILARHQVLRPLKRDFPSSGTDKNLLYVPENLEVSILLWLKRKRANHPAGVHGRDTLLPKSQISIPGIKFDLR